MSNRAEQAANEIYKDGIELFGRRDKNGNLIIHPETMVGILRNACQRGYEQAEKNIKEQMMKDAVEAYIVKSYNPCTENSELFLHGVELLYEDKNKPYLLAGNKVRIVVLKEED